MIKLVIVVLLAVVSQNEACNFGNFTLTVEKEKIRTDVNRTRLFVTDLDLEMGVTSLSFTVQACRDAHISLQPIAAGIAVRNPAYDILIGGWGNSQSGIRRKLEEPYLEEYHKRGLLDCNEARPFWVSWAGGVIRVGHGTYPSNFTMFMSFVDNNSLPIRGVALGTWQVPGVWLINKPKAVVSVHTKDQDFKMQVPNIDLTNASSISFKVRARDEAHVTLQPISEAFTRETYEIVIGGWRNTKSVIRRQYNGQFKAEYLGRVLNEKEDRSFWISWKDGRIAVGRGLVPGNSSRFMHYDDEMPLPIRAMTVSTNGMGRWQIYNP